MKTDFLSREILIGDIREVIVIAETDRQGYSFAWELTGPGRLRGGLSSPVILYLPPSSLKSSGEEAVISVTVTDERQQSASTSYRLTLRKPAPTPMPAATPTNTPKHQAPSTPEPSPLQQFDVDKLEVVGIIMGSLGNYARILAPNGQYYTVSAGTLIGRNKGEVISISRNTIILKETISYQNGKNEEVRTQLYLNPIEPIPTKAPTVTPTPKPLSCWEQTTGGTVCKEEVTGMEFVWIPNGCFQMGSPDDEEGRRGNEGPVHQVCLDGFWMGKYEVTNAQYRKWKRDHNSGEYKNGKSQPAVYVSWEDATRFAEWLTTQDGGQYTFSLPSEAQWEYAARAGTRTSRFWGNDPDDACGYANVYDLTSKDTIDWSFTLHDCNDGYAATAPVGGEGKFRANAFDLFDMLGNVWEWCRDTYSSDIYTRRSKMESVSNPIYNEGGTGRVLRGGSWSNDPRGVRCAYRYVSSPSYRDAVFGFRLARTISF
ncbi:MAG: SUMF1/EgtB/PvdO family nonheme iron enzyme [bacterium]|nr:SUMF1/EgtB/PvdO family nonheme iron enzyme [bacterium]